MPCGFAESGLLRYASGRTWPRANIVIPQNTFRSMEQTSVVPSGPPMSNVVQLFCRKRQQFRRHYRHRIFIVNGNAAPCGIACLQLQYQRRRQASSPHQSAPSYFNSNVHIIGSVRRMISLPATHVVTVVALFVRVIDRRERALGRPHTVMMITIELLKWIRSMWRTNNSLTRADKLFS